MQEKNKKIFYLFGGGRYVDKVANRFCIKEGGGRFRLKEMKIVVERVNSKEFCTI